ncbi:single-stranded DNA-binding protein [Paenibacillus sp. NAIST15-1]|nr:single-stranded DNA-binding protein [Paenibacillus sp. NAIST15-1]
MGCPCIRRFGTITENRATTKETNEYIRTGEFVKREGDHDLAANYQFERPNGFTGTGESLAVAAMGKR